MVRSTRNWSDKKIGRRITTITEQTVIACILTYRYRKNDNIFIYADVFAKRHRDHFRQRGRQYRQVRTDIITDSTSVCLSVCLSARISPEQCAWSLSNVVCMLSMAMALSSSGRVTKSQGKGAVFFGGGSSPCNALYSIAFGTHTITAEPIKMPFGPRNSVLLKGDDPR